MQALRPSSLTICASSRKKNDVCGLMNSIALPEAELDGPTAKPFEPVGSSKRGKRSADAAFSVAARPV
jgi:hypothetical protein